MENPDKVLETVCAALSTEGEIRLAEIMVRTYQQKLTYWQQQLEHMQRRKQVLDADLRVLGFHDLGHARGELGKQDDRLRGFEEANASMNMRKMASFIDRELGVK